MPLNCILPQHAERLKKAFEDGSITYSALYKMDSSQREALFRKYVSGAAKEVSARFEKSFLAPNQKLAARGAIFDSFGMKPLYTGIKISEAEKLANTHTMAELKKMTSEERLTALEGIFSNKLSEALNKRFDYLAGTKNLKLWEEKAMGTRELRENEKINKKIKGSLAKLEALNDLGVLNPADMESFMQNFVETRLGVDITLEQSRKLSKLVGEQEELYREYEKLATAFEYSRKSGWDFKGHNAFRKYLLKVKELQYFENELTVEGATVVEKRTSTANRMIDYFRGSILASPRIARNSAFYQAIPTVERFITKRLLSASVGSKELKSDFVTAIQAKAFAAKPSEKASLFVADQIMDAMRIYNDTGFDVARAHTINDGFRYFSGEYIGRDSGKLATVGEASGIKGKLRALKGVFNKSKKENFRTALDIGVDSVIKAPKWTAGGTDVLAANWQRADTSMMMSKEIAYLEASKRKFDSKAEKNAWIEQRSMTILKDSYSFNPIDPQGKLVRALGINDANVSNNTNESFVADKVTAIREKLSIGNVNFGKAIIPFARIAAAAGEKGIRTAAFPIELTYQLYALNKASKIENTVERATKMQKIVSSMIGTVSLMGAAVALSLFLDDDDYIGAYDLISYKEYGLAKARGGETGSIRIGGRWISLRYLPIINIPLAGIMEARQSKARGLNGFDHWVASYMRGIGQAVLDLPVLSSTLNFGEGLKDAITGKEVAEVLESMGMDGWGALDWAKVRAIPSVVSWDIWNEMFPKGAKEDFLGNPTNSRSWTGVRNDQSNEITFEFNRLNNQLDEKGRKQMPTISDPSGARANALLEKVGPKKYSELITAYKKEYAKEVDKLIKKNSYKKKEAGEQKEAINDIRTDEIESMYKKNKIK